jgi:hypothetical protein
MEDLKKSVLIKGDNIIGFTGRGVIPMTQEEFNALPPEKQLNGSYYITDGTDEIVISDNEISEKQLWSSKKVATELKTSSNTDVVPVTLLSDIPFLSKGDNYCYYKVVNGICYFQLFIESTADVITYTELCNSLPKPSLASVYFGFPAFYIESDVYKTLQVYISEDGVMSVNNSTNKASYMLNGSYPIA